jgi:hypothetical protein
MAELMDTSRAQLARVLDPTEFNVTIDTLARGEGAGSVVEGGVGLGRGIGIVSPYFGATLERREGNTLLLQS